MTGAFGEGSRHVGIFWLFKLDGLTSTGVFSVTPALPVTFRRIGLDSLSSLAGIMHMDDQALIIRRFQRGKRCYGGFHGDQIVTYGWVTFDEESIGELGLTARMREGECYIWDCATPPAHRGKRLYPALLAHILTTLAAEGIRRAWLGTDADNIPSQKGVSLVRYEPVLGVAFVPSSTGNAKGIHPRPNTERIGLIIRWQPARDHYPD